MGNLRIKFEKELYWRERRSRPDFKRNSLYKELQERWIKENKPFHYCFIDLDSLEKQYMNDFKLNQKSKQAREEED